MKNFDIIIVGGGIAGLSLALNLAESSLQDQSILIIDKNNQYKNDRTLSFWAKNPTRFDSIVSASWNRLQFISDDFNQTVDLQNYTYQMIRGIDFCQFVRQKLSGYPNVEFLNGTVSRIDDGDKLATVRVNDETITGHWIFDSRYKLADLYPNSAEAQVKLYFKGWEIETSTPMFDTQAATLMDFRTPQKEDTRFFYVLPYTPQRALVEYSLFSAQQISGKECEQALRDHIENKLGITEYRIVYREGGIIPATNRSLPRKVGRRVMTIGTRGGRVKPTTGYAFMRIQEDSACIVKSLERTGHPFNVPSDSYFFSFCDRLMLDVMAHHGQHLKPIFTAMFKHNSIKRIFRFLDEETALWENLQLIATLPPRIFLQTLFQLSASNPKHPAPQKPAITPPLSS